MTHHFHRETIVIVLSPLIVVGVGLLTAVAAPRLLGGVALANEKVPAPLIVEKPTPAISGSGRLVEDVGIETLGGVFTVLLSRGCKTPCIATKTFSTAEEAQPEIKLHLFRGTAKLAKEAHSLGIHVFRGIPPLPRGVPQIDVTFAAEADYISISAIERKSGRYLNIERRER
jgi:molecular chaperone DnaK (HSP70)